MDVKTALIELFESRDPVLRGAVRAFMREMRIRGRPRRIPMKSLENCLDTYQRLARYAWSCNEEDFKEDRERINGLRGDLKQLIAGYKIHRDIDIDEKLLDEGV